MQSPFRWTSSQDVQRGSHTSSSLQRYFRSHRPPRRGSLSVPVSLAWYDPGHLPSHTDSLFCAAAGVGVDGNGQEQCASARSPHQGCQQAHQSSVLAGARWMFQCPMRSRVARGLCYPGPVNLLAMLARTRRWVARPRDWVNLVLLTPQRLPRVALSPHLCVQAPRGRGRGARGFHRGGGYPARRGYRGGYRGRGRGGYSPY